MKRSLRLSAALALVWMIQPSEPGQAQGPYQYHALTPCRVVDTRNAPGPNAGPILQGGVERTFTMQGTCGVPSGAAAVTINVTIAAPTNSGHLTVWPAGLSRPLVSTLNWNPGEPALANGAIVPLAATTPDLAVRPVVVGAGTVHVIVDVTGYFD